LSLSPLRGEGNAIGHRHYSFGVRHSFDGVQRTARPNKFGSWVVSRSEWNREFSMKLWKEVHASSSAKATEDNVREF